eukprot:GHVU01109684.1.p1 GENE.GHVU01109684.1~~GHVU01109684.1.p1  ORF type:complete len:135 (-),score=13.10 GHVU01109684.1:44-448(-)
MYDDAAALQLTIMCNSNKMRYEEVPTDFSDRPTDRQTNRRKKTNCRRQNSRCGGNDALDAFERLCPFMRPLPQFRIVPHSLTPSLNQSLTDSQVVVLKNNWIPTLTHSLTHSPSLTHSLTLHRSLTHSLTHRPH